MPDDLIEPVPLEHFLGLQRITHCHLGQNGILGIDGLLYRFQRLSTPCNQRVSYTDSFASTERARKNGHSSYCEISTLLGVWPYSEDELETLSLILDINTKRIRCDRMVMFFKRADCEMIYGRDEAWGTPASGKVICQFGTEPDGTDKHDRFTFYFNSAGYEPAWLQPKPLDEEPGPL